TMPAPVAVAPVTDWRKSGTNEIAPNIAMPARKRVTTAAMTMRLPKSRSGTIGSAARRSTTTNSTSPVRPSASGLSTAAPDQDPARPACTMPSRSADTPAVKRATPATSMTGRRAGRASSTSAVEIREPPPERHRDRLREQEAREDPRVDLDPAEASHDRRHRRGDDGGLHRREENGQHDPDEDAPLRPLLHQWPPVQPAQRHSPRSAG